MSFEAVPCVFKSRDESGKESPMFGLLIRPSGQQSTSLSASSNSATPTITTATTAIPIAPVNSITTQPSTQIQILQGPPSTSATNANSLPKTTILRPIGTACASSAALLAAARSADPASILRPVTSTTGFTLASPVKLPQTKTTKKSNAAATTTASTPSTTCILSSTKSTPAIHNFCNDLPVTAEFSAVNDLMDKTRKKDSKKTKFENQQLQQLNVQPECSSFSAIDSESSLNAYQPPPQQQLQQPSTSSNTNNNSAMNESAALEDLNSIEMNQLLTNTSAINTEDYLDQSLNSNMDFYVNQPSTSNPAPHQFTYPDQSQKHPQQMLNERPIESSNFDVQIYSNHQQHQQMASKNKYSHNYYSHQQSIPPMMHHQSSSSLLQPVHQNDHPHMASQQHQHFHQQRPSTSYNYNYQHQIVDHRRVAMLNGLHPSGSNQLSTSPDSGIQSIDGSPPSTFTPPMVSPYTVQTSNYDHTTHGDPNNYHPHLLNHCPPSCSTTISNPVVSVQSTRLDEEDDEDDFSDMPTLVRVDQMDHSDSTAERPHLLKLDTSCSSSCNDNSSSLSRSNSRASAGTSSKTDEEKEALIAITPGMDLAEIAERLASTMDTEKLKQFTSLIQSKVKVDEVPKSNDASVDIPSFKTPTKAKKAQKEASKRRRNEDTVSTCKLDSKADNEQSLSQLIKTTLKAAESDEEDKKTMESSRRRYNQPLDEQELAQKNERLRQHRLKVDKKLRARLALLIEQIGDEFQNIHLGLGRCHRFPLPWQIPNWKEVEKRCQERASNQKQLKRKSNEPASLEELKRPKLTVEDARRPQLETVSTIAKRNRGRPRQKLPKLEAQVAQAPLSAKRGPGRPRSKNLLKPERMVKGVSSFQNFGQASKKEKSKSRSPVIQRRKQSKNRNDFVKIRTNVFVDAPPRLPESNSCSCTASNPCITRTCSHRAAFEECTQATCQWHDQCQNRRMGNNEAIHQLQIFDTNKYGRGVRSAIEIYPGQFICEFVGEVVKHSHYQLRNLLRSENVPHFGIHLTNNYILDATQRGSIARFINHSCEPNCEMQKWMVNGYYRLGIFAKRKIEEGEELTYDYSMFAQMEPPQKCECGNRKCQGYIPCYAFSKKLACEAPPTLSKSQLAIVRQTRVLLPRNLKKYNPHAPNRSVPLYKKYPELSSFLLGIYENTIQHAEAKERIAQKRITQLCISLRRLMNMTHKTPDELTERFDGIVRTWINALHPFYDRRCVEALRSHFVHLKKTRDIERHCPRLAKDTMRMFMEDRKRLYISAKRDCHRVLSAEADLSYIGAGCPVGTYNPDEQTMLPEKSAELDCVRCLCGITEDDGKMVLCDRCNFWMHADCVSYDSSNTEDFECDFCKKSLRHTPAVDIVLKPQPEIKFPGCTYYRTLVNSRGLQVRVNESVYVERLINDDYKAILKSMHEECAQGQKKRGRKAKNSSVDKLFSSRSKLEFGRQDVRHFRVERLFVSPQGQRFVFGCYYARPHETFCDSNRLFHRNELFWTPMFDTLPLDAVIGRCLILEPVNWIEGRPRVPKYNEEDVYVCEYQIDKNQRSFAKIQSANHYYLNTADYVFEKFVQKLELKRDFTPFVLGPAGSKTERNEHRERVMNVAKELSARRLNRAWKRLLNQRSLGDPC